MPEEKKSPSQVSVDLDTSGPEVDVSLEETKEEAVVNTDSGNTDQETVKEVIQETQEDKKLEDYSTGVQSRIAKLTRKMREAERREQAALQYAGAIEEKRKLDKSRFDKIDSDYQTKFETNVKTGLETAQRDLAMSIENGDAAAQVEANKKIAQLAFENAKLEQRKTTRPVEQEQPVQLSDGGNLPRETPRSLPQADPMAEDWATKNEWFGKDRAMTFTAFEIHKDLVEKEGYDPMSNEYYEEVDKRIRVDFGHKFGNNDTKQTNRAVQSVASANRSTKPGRKTVRLTSSQVAIAKKLGCHSKNMQNN